MTVSALIRALLQEAVPPSPQIGPVAWVVVIGLLVLVIASMWRIFQMAGQPGWAAIVPIYNMVVLLQVAGKPVWWIILLLIPIVNIVVIFLTYLGLARNFGKSGLYAVGLLLLSPIFLPMLAFGGAQYRPAAA